MLAALLATILAPLSASEEGGWKLRKAEDGIEVYSRPRPGSKFDELRSLTRIRGTVDQVFRQLQKAEAWPELNPLVASARLQEQLSDSESLVYFTLDMPWPVSDRDVLYHRSVTRDCDRGVIRIEETATPEGLPAQKGLVRILESSQSWILAPSDEQMVAVEWTGHTDPNGPIPSPIVNRLSTNAPFDTLSRLREQVEAAGAPAGMPELCQR